MSEDHTKRQYPPTPREEAEQLMEEFECDICGSEEKGIPNNPDPIKGEECCDTCNEQVVIPLRIRIFTRRKEVQEREIDE